MKLILGPMQGVLDGLMRQLLTQMNPYDFCVTEFIRVVDMKLPARVFHSMCPELKTHGKTLSGTPVRVQLLGQSPEYMAENAALAVELGSFGVDLNFGCPSKTVNGNKGGAALLKDPEKMYQIIKAVRNAVPKDAVVSAKVRLGFNDCSSYHEIASAVELGGANEIVVHGRSKADAYKEGTVRWDIIGDIVSRLNIPVIANGDIWGREDAFICMSMTGSDQLMVCRGALHMPNLALHLKHGAKPLSWDRVLELLVRYSEFEIRADKGVYYPNRVKQWFRYLLVEYPEAKSLFFQLRALNDKKEILALIYQAQHASKKENKASVLCECI